MLFAIQEEQPNFEDVKQYFKESILAHTIETFKDILCSIIWGSREEDGIKQFDSYTYNTLVHLNSISECFIEPIKHLRKKCQPNGLEDSNLVKIINYLYKNSAKFRCAIKLLNEKPLCYPHEDFADITVTPIANVIINNRFNLLNTLLELGLDLNYPALVKNIQGEHLCCSFSDFAKFLIPSCRAASMICLFNQNLRSFHSPKYLELHTQNFLLSHEGFRTLNNDAKELMSNYMDIKNILMSLAPYDRELIKTVKPHKGIYIFNNPKEYNEFKEQCSAADSQKSTSTVYLIFVERLKTFEFLNWLVTLLNKKLYQHSHSSKIKDLDQIKKEIQRTMYQYCNITHKQRGRLWCEVWAMVMSLQKTVSELDLKTQKELEHMLLQEPPPILRQYNNECIEDDDCIEDYESDSVHKQEQSPPVVSSPLD